MLRPLAILALVSAAAMALGGCSAPTATQPAASVAPSQANTRTYPISIKHSYGTTTIPAKPQRVATVAWANHEVPLALGVVPVGMSKATWGDDDGDGVLPWVGSTSLPTSTEIAGPPS